MVTSHQKVHQMVGVCSLSALAFILMLFEFPILPVAPYLKMDFSDLPVLIGGFIYGPAAGVMVAFLKCLIHAMTQGFSAGELEAQVVVIQASIMVREYFGNGYFSCSDGPIKLVGTNTTIHGTVELEINPADSGTNCGSCYSV